MESKIEQKYEKREKTNKKQDESSIGGSTRCIELKKEGTKERRKGREIIIY